MRILYGLAAGGLLLAQTAIAQMAPPPPPPPGGQERGGMMRADANGDGIITRQEMMDQAGQRFDRMDANHDGKLDPSEMERVGRMMRGARGGGDMPPPPPPAPTPNQ